MCLSMAVLTESPVERFSFLVVVGLTAVRPVWMICLFLLLMPLFGGSHAGTHFTLRFFLILWGICLGGSVRLLWERFAKNQLIFMGWKNPVFFSIMVLWIATGLSLTSVGFDSVLWGIFLPNSTDARVILTINEGSRLYPWCSFLSFTLVLWVGYFMVALSMKDPRAPQFFLQSLGLGALVSLVLGMLDYFNVLNINGMRPPEYEVAWRFSRLTSTFGNPTWYAQYIVLVAPSILSLLFVKARRWIVILMMITVIVLTEVGIVLINQRGGWISYPLTLCVIWFCIYAVDHADSGGLRVFQTALRRTGKKIAISLPATIGISMIVLYFLVSLDSSYRGRIDNIKGRAETLTHYQDRLAYLVPTIKLWSMHPLFGGGADSFQSRYQEAFLIEGHVCVYDDPYTREYQGSAHNIYFQTLAGKGLIGLLALLGVMGASIIVSLTSFSKPYPKNSAVGSNQDRRILLMAGFAYTVAMVIYGNVGEIFFSPANYMVFVVFMASLITASNGTVEVSLKTLKIILGLLGLALLLHVAIERSGVIQTCVLGQSLLRK